MLLLSCPPYVVLHNSSGVRCTTPDIEAAFSQTLRDEIPRAIFLAMAIVGAKIVAANTYCLSLPKRFTGAQERWRLGSLDVHFQEIDAINALFPAYCIQRGRSYRYSGP